MLRERKRRDGKVRRLLSRNCGPAVGTTLACISISCLSTLPCSCRTSPCILLSQCPVVQTRSVYIYNACVFLLCLEEPRLSTILSQCPVALTRSVHTMLVSFNCVLWHWIPDMALLYPGCPFISFYRAMKYICTMFFI